MLWRGVQGGWGQVIKAGEGCKRSRVSGLGCPYDDGGPDCAGHEWSVLGNHR